MLFSSDRDENLNIYSKAADGTGPPERLTTSDSVQAPQSWSGDGQSLVIFDFPGDANISVVSLGAESRTEGLIETEFTETYPEVSPDGRWIAYMSNESGRFEVYVSRLRLEQFFRRQGPREVKKLSCLNPECPVHNKVASGRIIHHGLAA